MRVLVTGTRRYLGTDEVLHAMRVVHERFGPCTLIHGGAKGVDSIANDIADQLGWNIWKFPAEWDYYKWMGAVMRDEGMKKAAGVIRNREMLETLPPDLCLAFPWFHKSSGTWDMVTLCKKAGVPVKVFELK